MLIFPSFVMRSLLPAVLGFLVWQSAAFAAPAKPVNDPLEPVNRAIFSFNQAADTYFIRPIVVGYRYVAPQAIRTRLGNVSDNLMEPINFMNAMLQGDFSQGMVTFWRFLINSTVGIAGIHDVAKEAGLPRRAEDFGQTLGAWGVDSGPYLVLPLLGPSNARDLGGFVADIFTSPLTYYVDRADLIAISVAQAGITRDRLFDPIDQINQSALDPYATYRSIYEQRRSAQVENSFRGGNNTMSTQ